MGKTLIQIKDKIKTFAQNHRQINYYGTEKEWSINSSGTINYPVLWSIYDGLELRRGEKGYRFTFYSLDLLQTDRANIEDIFNDTDMTLSDLMASLEWGGDADIDIKVDSFNLEKVDEGFEDDIVAGHKTEVVIWTDFKLNECTIPVIT